eukprot:TRINITY_DN14010_c0_g1_i2.p1 TRINITY_DN14010_c0_g1~~TRINITY_DN14010_c0_g1_i2.p1  ORF type:complete len:385 (+),score=100.24 TRINITY_DN14010_c0_g1_i2:270-1424(+)
MPSHPCLAKLAQAHPDQAALYDNLDQLKDRKLWHQLTQALLEFQDNPRFEQGDELITLHREFVSEFESKLNKLSFAQLAIRAARQISDPAAAQAFLKEAEDAVAADSEAKLMLSLQQTLVQAAHGGDASVIRKALDAAREELEAAESYEAVVHASYHRVAFTLHKREDQAAEYFQHALRFLAYTPLEDILIAERQSIAFDLAIAALIGKETYAFGELLAHPVVKVLEGDYGWLLELVVAFNVGDLEAYTRVTTQFKDKLNAIPALTSNIPVLEEKIALMALRELAFHRPAEDRALSFDEVSKAIRRPLPDVEPLIMRAISLNLIRGVIDGVDRTVRVSWVRPQVLNRDQIAVLGERLKSWSANVSGTYSWMENTTPELFATEAF